VNAGRLTPRPPLLVLVAGTGTEIGKTWWAATVAGAVRDAGLTVAARKPAQSFDPDDRVTDAEVLGAATGEDPSVVCLPHRWYEVPMAPPMAAAALGRPGFTTADLVGELAWPDGVAVGIVETAGGPRSPLADDGDSVSLAAALAPDVVVLVADAGLGTINAVRLSLVAFTGVAPVVVVLNRYDDDLAVHHANRAWLATTDGVDVVTTLDDLVARLTKSA
jgi:dethiobiotin synthetase